MPARITIAMSLIAIGISLISLLVLLWDRFWGKFKIEMVFAQRGILHLQNEIIEDEPMVLLKKAHLGLVFINKGPKDGIVSNLEVMIKNKNNMVEIRLEPMDFLDYKNRSSTTKTIFHPIVVPKFGSCFEWINFNVISLKAEDQNIKLVLEKGMNKFGIASSYFLECTFTMSNTKKDTIKEHFEFVNKKIKLNVGGIPSGFWIHV